MDAVGDDDDDDDGGRNRDRGEDDHDDDWNVHGPYCSLRILRKRAITVV